MMGPCTEEAMTKCPMCGHCTIGGPVYRRGNWGNRYYGWLVYWCKRCGFENKTPTKEDRDSDRARHPELFENKPHDR
jgi:DNA-directed RNA polymerase subunit RPC12/RpoP